MKDRPDRHHDRTPRTVEPTQLKSHNLVIFTNLELHHVALEAVEKLAKFACLWDDVNIEAGIGELSFHELRGGLDRSLGIREKVDVFGGPRNDAVCYQEPAEPRWSETGRLPASGGGPSTQRRMA